MSSRFRQEGLSARIALIDKFNWYNTDKVDKISSPIYNPTGGIVS